MASATAGDYHKAIQNLRTCVSDEELREGETTVNALGLPIPCSGNFADVYRVHCQGTKNTWAVKCFTRETPGLRERYRAISDHLQRTHFPFMVEFSYVEPGIRVGSGWRPFLKMRWIEGLTLNYFVAQHLHNSKTLRNLLEVWLRLSIRLRNAGIAHGDLQHDNVLLVPVAGTDRLGLQLVDYDGMYVPALANNPSGEAGHPSYQHPLRLRGDAYSANMDSFSQLVVYCAVHCLLDGRGALWERFDNGDNLLFREPDFKQPGNSELFQDLWAAPNPRTRSLVSHLILASQSALHSVPPLDKIVNGGRVRQLSSVEEAQVRSIMNGEPRQIRSAPYPHSRLPTTEVGLPKPFARGQLTPPQGESTIQTAESALPTGRGRLDCRSAMPTIAEIPAGEFDVGDESIPNAAPRHRRRLSQAIWIDAGTVTWAHFEAFIAAGGYTSPEFWAGGDAGEPQMPTVSADQRLRALLEETKVFRKSLSSSDTLSREQPVTGLTWFEARAVARYYGARLPFEVEWEIAMSESDRPGRRGNTSYAGLPAGRSSSKYGCIVCCDFLQEWTADAFSARYWRADLHRVGTLWVPQVADNGVTVRGSSADDVYHHLCFRFPQNPASGDPCRTFRRVWDERPPANLVAPR